jgi:hypothetical protein
MHYFVEKVFYLLKLVHGPILEVEKQIADKEDKWLALALSCGPIFKIWTFTILNQLWTNTWLSRRPFAFIDRAKYF